MDVQQAYNLWAEQYDGDENKTRDLEAVALKEALDHISFKTVLEMGCGTGKNTGWLAHNAEHITAVDLSEKMLEKAKEKIQSDKVLFVQANMLEHWHFAPEPFDVVTFSLVLEHIEHLQPLMEKAARAVKMDGYVYAGELHPYKQYSGSKARFETSEGIQVVPCYTHHFAHFIQAATKAGLQLIKVEEYFDDGDNKKMPRILSLLFQKIATLPGV